MSINPNIPNKTEYDNLKLFNLRLLGENIHGKIISKGTTTDKT